MKLHPSKMLGRFALNALACFVCMSPMAFSQAVASVNCSDCATMPKPLDIPKPVYPPKAREMNVSGKVSVRIVIDENGNVIEAKADSGDEVLREAAEVAALKAKFEPARSIFAPRPAVKSFGQITYNFVLDDPPTREKRDVRKLGIVNGMADYLPIPVYSQSAKKFCASGKVGVEVLIGKTGTVLQAKPISGNHLLFGSAIKAAKRARFRHITDAPPIRIRGILVYNFQRPAGCATIRKKRNPLVILSTYAKTKRSYPS